jgi:uncharacterized repeat protein (TIGR01451 family)
VINNGATDATGVSIADILPAGVTYVSDDGGGDYDHVSGVWTIGDLPEETSRTLHVQATVDVGTAGQTITNLITDISADQEDSEATADDLEATIVVSNETDLQVIKTVDNGTPDEGDTITYTLTLSNNGPARATNVSLTDLLPEGVTYVSDDGGGNYDHVSGVWTIGTLEAAENATLHITATVDIGTAGHVITNFIVNVTADQDDSNDTPDDSSEDIVVGGGTDLAVSKTVDNGAPDEGDTITYTLTVVNNGPAQATGVSITDPLPDGVTYVGHTGDGSYDSVTGVWTVGTLDNGESATIEIQATVDAGTAGTVITNSIVDVSLDQDDSNTTEDDLDEDISIGNDTDLYVTKVVDDPSPIEGRTVVFTITVENRGPARATGVSLTDVLPEGLTYVSDDGGGSYVDHTGVWTVGTLEAGEAAVLHIHATVDPGTSGTQITNEITEVSIDQNDSNLTEDDLIEVLDIDIDTDGDGVDDPDDIDDDNDGILDVDEGDGAVDTDGDGHPDSLDIDSDNDGIVDNIEAQEEGHYRPPVGTDTDHDGWDDAYDADNGGTPIVIIDTDLDETPDYLDPDTDDDTVPDTTEGSDANHDGRPDVVATGSDTDGDGLDDAYDTFAGPGYGNETGSNAPLQDTDGDGIRDWRDPDDDDDGINTIDEDWNGNDDPTDDDDDGDGTPDYLDPDQVVPGDIGLSKSASLERVAVGGMIPYVLIAENLASADKSDVTFEDNIPAGFALVEGSTTLTRAGEDGEFGTVDDVESQLRASLTRPVIFGPIDLAGFEKVRIRYLLRVGSGVLPGEHVNTAIPYIEDEPAGNEARETVTVEADPTLDRSTIIGKVFNDIDGDGRQDVVAGATGVRVSGGAAAERFVPYTTTVDWGEGPRVLDGEAPLASGIELGDLVPAGASPGVSRAVIRTELTSPEPVEVSVSSEEGTRTVVLGDGTIREEHVGDVGGGLNGQHIVIDRNVVSTTNAVEPEGEWTTETRDVLETETVKLRNVIDPIHFESGKSDITNDQIETLRQVISDLSGKENVGLHIVGHTDSQRLSAHAKSIYGDNYGLGRSRAEEVGRMLADALGLPEEAVSTESRGPDEPVASNETPEGMAENRRAEVEVWYDEKVDHVRQVTDDVYVEHEAEPATKHELVITVSNAGACEEGIAGARLATTDGLVVETDELGRYHLADVDGGRFDRGGVFAIKADEAYLPEGAVFTTENPRVIRITPGMTEEIDFGVRLPDDTGAAGAGEPAGAKMARRVELTSGEQPMALSAIGEAGMPWKPGLRVLPDRYFFMVGFANVTVGANDVTGSTDIVEDDYHYDGDVFTDGRIAFYMKSKVGNRLLVTAQMDTDENELKHLFDDFDRTDPRKMFRRLDPDLYYPTYGDDSVTFLDTDSQGKFYVRADWDRSNLMWGNYNTDLTGTEYGRYDRSFYGAMGHVEAMGQTEAGDGRLELTAFGSEPKTAFAHVEFQATGGSLYYLKHTDIVQGSEKLWVEIRQRDSGRLVERVTLERGRDYELDDIQGRVILARPLTQIADQAGPSLIKDVPLDGNHVFLLADYEYVPDEFDTDDVTAGGRAKAWLTDGLAVGGTYVREEADVKDYELTAADLTVSITDGTYLRAEYAASEATRSGVDYVSTDGGLSFDPFNPSSSDEDVSGEALLVEGRIALEGDKKETEGDAVAAWWKQRDAGFAVTGLETGTKVTEYGGEGKVHVGSALGLSARGVVTDRDGVGTGEVYAAQADVAVTSRLSLGAEVQYSQTTPDEGKESNATLGAATIGYDIANAVNVYGIGQFTIDKTDDVPDNNLGTIGVRGRIGEKLALRAEGSSGDLGTGANIGADYAISDLHTMYGTYTLNPDHTGAARGVFTLGQRKSVSDQLKVYTEHQFSRSKRLTEIAQIYGLDFAVTDWTTVGLAVQSMDLDNDDYSSVERDVASVYASYGKGRTKAGAKLEYRRDDGAAEREQWLTTNALNYRVTDDLTLQGKFSLSTTTNDGAVAAGSEDDEEASFVEAAAGFAYRPACGLGPNVLGRYTYLKDLPDASQTPDAGVQQRSSVFELEGIQPVWSKLDLGGKVARKLGELRFDGSDGDWFTTEVNFAAVKARFHVRRAWDGLLEYRWLEVKETKDARQGVLAGLYRQIGDNLRVGVGYNFTDFTDDLMDLDYKSHGWFIDVTGSY